MEPEMLPKGNSEPKLVQEFWKELQFGCNTVEITQETQGSSVVRFDAILKDL
jgi:hypothetical protein